MQMLTACVCGALAAVFWAGAAAAADLQPHQQLALQMLTELVETDTTHSTGDTTRAAKYLASQLRRAGFSRRDVRVLEEVPRKARATAAGCCAALRSKKARVTGLRPTGNTSSRTRNSASAR